MVTVRWRESVPEFSGSEVTYPEVGGTRDTPLPDGYAHLRRRVRVGSGREVFDRAVRCLHSFAMHRGAGVSVSPRSSVAVDGHVVVLSLGIGPCRIFVPCTVVWTVDTAVQAGFAYGTLPGHDECGEESFIAEIDEQDEVWFTITAFSRPATWYARLGAPINKALQHRITTRYLQALITCVHQDTG